MAEYRINTECLHCKEAGILDYNPVGTDGVHSAWINSVFVKDCGVMETLIGKSSSNIKYLCDNKFN